MRKSVQTIAVAVACVLFASTAAYAMGGGAAGAAQGEPLRNEARSGQDTLPPAEDADVVRERERTQDRLQDGSCEQCTGSATQTRTQSKQQAATGGQAGSRLTAGAAAGGDDAAQQRARVRNAIRNLVRVEMRLQRMDGEGAQASQPALIAFALRLAERLQAWLAAQ